MSDITITLPLTRYLSALCGHREFAVISHAEGEQITTLDPTEEVCHVERMPDTSYIYPIKEWRASAEKLMRLKRDADDRRRIYNLEKETNATIFDKIRITLSPDKVMTYDVLYQTIKPFIDSKNTSMLGMFNFTEEEMTWIMNGRLHI